MQLGAAHDDAATVADGDRAVALGEHFGQRPGIGRRQPQTQEMAAALRLGPVHEAGAVVQELIPGYLIAGRLLRAAMVAVSKGGPALRPASNEN